MITNNAVKVVEFAPHDKFTAVEIQISRLPKNFEEVLTKVRPVFNEWILAEATFEHNTLAVAKAMRKAWEVYKAGEPTGTKVTFASHFDATIPAGATVRDVVTNATYNRIQYLLHKVIPAADSSTTETAAQRIERREKHIRAEWHRFMKKADSEQVDQVKTLLAKILEEFLPTTRIEKVLG